jgi:hypothetical protein
MVPHTDHSAFRSAQRGLNDEEIEYVRWYGSCHHGGGALIYFLRSQDLPPADRNWDWANHLVGTALVFSPDGEVLMTVWRNRRKGLKIIRKKGPHYYKGIQSS